MVNFAFYLSMALRIYAKPEINIRRYCFHERLYLADFHIIMPRLVFFF